MYSFSFVMLCLIWSYTVIYEHIWYNMIKYGWIWVDDMFANSCNTCPSQNCRAGSFQVSVFRCLWNTNGQQGFARPWRHAKHACFAFPNWCLQKRLVKNDSTNMGVLSVLSILSILRPSWSCLSLFRLLNNSRERSNHKQSRVIFCGQYCLLLWSVMIF